MSEWEKSDRRAWIEAFIVSSIILSPLIIMAVLLSSDVVTAGMILLSGIVFSGMLASNFKDHFKAKLKQCPFIHNCPQEVTEKYFETYCDSHEYLFCHYFPKPKSTSLRQTPSKWLHAKEKSESDG